jgi:O-antigen ligase
MVKIQKGIEYGLIILIIFTPLCFGSVHPWAYTGMELVVIFLLILWVYISLKKGLIYWAKTPLNIPILLFVILILFQIIPLPDFVLKIISPKTKELYNITLPSISYFNSLTIYKHATKLEFFKIVSYLGIFFLIINNLNKKSVDRIIIAIIMIGFIIAIIGIVQKYTAPKKIYGFRDASYASPFGPYVNRNHFAGYMEMVVPLTLGFLLSRFKFLSFREENLKTYISSRDAEISKSLLLTFIIVITSSSILLSLSRGGTIGLFLSLMLFFVIRLRRRKWFIIFVILNLIFIFILWIGIDPIINRLLTLKNSYTMERSRIRIWKGVINMIKDFPIFGTGLGTFPYISPKYKSIKSALLLEHAHNDYLELISEVGIIGFIIFIYGILSFYKWTVKGLKNRKNPWIIIGGLISLYAILFHSLVDFNMHIPANSLLFFIILGLVTLKNNPSYRVIKIDYRGKIFGSIFIGIAFLLISISVIKTYIGNLYYEDFIYNKDKKLIEKAIEFDTSNSLYQYWLGKVYENRGSFNEAAVQYKKAISLEPTNPWYHLSLGWINIGTPIGEKEFKLALLLAPNNLDIINYVKDNY